MLAGGQGPRVWGRDASVGSVHPPHLSVGRGGAGDMWGAGGSSPMAQQQQPQQQLTPAYAAALRGVQRISAERPSEEPPPRDTRPHLAREVHHHYHTRATGSTTNPDTRTAAQITRLEGERNRLREQLRRERERTRRHGAVPSSYPADAPHPAPATPGAWPSDDTVSLGSSVSTAGSPHTVAPDALAVPRGAPRADALAQMRCMGTMAVTLERARDELVRLREECGDFGVKQSAARADELLRGTEDELERLEALCVRRDDDHRGEIRRLTEQLHEEEDEKAEVTARLRELIATTSEQLGSLRRECASTHRQLEDLTEDYATLLETSRGPGGGGGREGRWSAHADDQSRERSRPRPSSPPRSHHSRRSVHLSPRRSTAHGGGVVAPLGHHIGDTFYTRPDGPPLGRHRRHRTYDTSPTASPRRTLPWQPHAPPPFFSAD